MAVAMNSSAAAFEFIEAQSSCFCIRKTSERKQIEQKLGVNEQMRPHYQKLNGLSMVVSKRWFEFGLESTFPQPTVTLI